MDTTRRSLLLAGAAAGGALAQSGGLTAGEIVRRIQQQVGVPWRLETVDTYKAGGPETRVKGVAVTMMATLDVLQKAAAAGRNFVITHEPTFYNHQDLSDGLTDNPVYRFKTAFIREHDMAIFRFHDHWHARRPDGIGAGMVEELGWGGRADAGHRSLFRFDGIALSDLARQMRTKLKIRAMRVVGDPALRARAVSANWGYANQQGGIRTLASPEVDVAIVGEAREWEVVEYAADAISAGNKKGLIVLGHIVSEQAGMKYCARWLKGFVSEVPVEFVPAEEPFWTVA